jgi:ligand-binding sensor domain-containing protein
MNPRLRFWLAACACISSVVLGSTAEARASTTTRIAGLDVSALATSPDALFVGAFDRGLFRVRETGPAEELVDPALHRHVNALAWDISQQVLWVGTARGLSACGFSPRFACRRIGDASPIHALLVLRDGSIAAGGDGGLGFVDRRHDVSVWRKKEGAPFRSVWSLAETRDGVLLVGTTNGLFWGRAADFAARRQHAIKRAALVNGMLPDDWVTAVAIESDRVYVGTYNAGVASFERNNGDLVAHGSDTGLGYVNAAGLLPLGADGLAVATMDGLRVGALGAMRQVATLALDVTAVVAAPAGGGYFVATRKGVQWLASLTPRSS